MYVGPSQGQGAIKKVAYESFIFILVALVTVYTYLFKKDYVNRLHLRIVWMGRKLQVSWWKHEEYVALKEAELADARLERDPAECISFALSEVQDCNYIVFDCGDDDRFVQFWLGDGKLMVNWPTHGKKNKLKKYIYPMLGVLNELDITQRPTRVGSSLIAKYQYYEYFTQALNASSAKSPPLPAYPVRSISVGSE